MHTNEQTLHSTRQLYALSPLDGRYEQKVSKLRAIMSEAGFMHHRVQVELAWLKALSTLGLPELPAFSKKALAKLNAIAEQFNATHAQRIKEFEAQTNHDVKAVEYFIKEAFNDEPALKAAVEFVHFACTSEDINNVSHAMMLKTARNDVICPKLQELLTKLKQDAHALADVPMMCRTHGQPASPSTMGKELANVLARVQRAHNRWQTIELPAKMNGAVGNYNAHYAAYPNIDWPNVSKSLIESLGLEFNPYTIQIEPHDGIAEYMDAVARINTILIDFCRDVWGYISLGYFKQKLKEGEVGSSTMPHKVNPIDFENAEGNFGLANALLKHLSEKLPISRWQRDLSDSTVLRNMGVALGYTLLGLESCLKGLNKLECNPDAMLEDLDNCWELLAEPVQTVMRRYGLPNPYEQLKALTRGQGINRDTLQQFIRNLDLPTAEKERLLDMKPSNYLGISGQLAKSI